MAIARSVVVGLFASVSRQETNTGGIRPGSLRLRASAAVRAIYRAFRSHREAEAAALPSFKPYENTMTMLEGMKTTGFLARSTPWDLGSPAHLGSPFVLAVAVAGVRLASIATLQLVVLVASCVVLNAQDCRGSCSAPSIWSRSCSCSRCAQLGITTVIPLAIGYGAPVGIVLLTGAARPPSAPSRVSEPESTPIQAPRSIDARPFFWLTSSLDFRTRSSTTPSCLVDIIVGKHAPLAQLRAAARFAVITVLLLLISVRVRSRLDRTTRRSFRKTSSRCAVHGRFSYSTLAMRMDSDRARSTPADVPRRVRVFSNVMALTRHALATATEPHSAAAHVVFLLFNATAS